VQFDFNLPARFELEYVGEDGARHQPVMVHRALFGSVERFFGVLIEHYAGAFPLWLAPVQIALVPIAERHHPYAEKVQRQLQEAGFRVELDSRNEKMNAKIREFTMQKVPYILVMGDKEAENESVSVRIRGNVDGGVMPLAEFQGLAAHVNRHRLTTLDREAAVTHKLGLIQMATLDDHGDTLQP
jgi:threonyl-tRNA synthetase